MQIFQDLFFFQVVFFVSGLLSVEVVTWTILSLCSKDSWGEWQSCTSLAGRVLYISLCSVLLLVRFSALFLFKKNKCDVFKEGSSPRSE